MVEKIQGDPELAKFFAEFNVKPDRSKIIETDLIATAFNTERLGRFRIVLLSYRHRVITKNRYHVDCGRCAEMYKHGFDMDGYFKGFVPDNLVWTDDPCRVFNEPLNGFGEFNSDCTIASLDRG